MGTVTVWNSDGEPVEIEFEHAHEAEVHHWNTQGAPTKLSEPEIVVEPAQHDNA